MIKTEIHLRRLQALKLEKELGLPVSSVTQPLLNCQHEEASEENQENQEEQNETHLSNSLTINDLICMATNEGVSVGGHRSSITQVKLF